jgi:hypothetical protein
LAVEQQHLPLLFFQLHHVETLHGLCYSQYLYNGVEKKDGNVDLLLPFLKKEIEDDDGYHLRHHHQPLC